MALRRASKPPPATDMLPPWNTSLPCAGRKFPNDIQRLGVELWDDDADTDADADAEAAAATALDKVRPVSMPAG